MVTIVEMAKDSCDRALVEQVALSDPLEGADTNASAPLSVSYDAGWSKRGTGRSYDSNTGQGVLIGKSSRKCLDFSVRSKVW